MKDRLVKYPYVLGLVVCSMVTLLIQLLMFYIDNARFSIGFCLTIACTILSVLVIFLFYDLKDGRLDGQAVMPSWAVDIGSELTKNRAFLSGAIEILSALKAEIDKGTVPEKA